MIFPSLFERFKSQVVDLFLIYMPILYFLAYFIGDGKSSFENDFIYPLIASAIYGLIISIFLSIKSQTPGKKAYNIKLMRDDLKKISFLFACFYVFVFLLSASSFIGLCFSFFREDKKALHDIIMKTTNFRTNK